MSTPNDSILVTPGSGATVAMHTPSGLSKELQAIVLCDAVGHLYGTKDTYLWNFPVAVLVAAASTIHADIFNAVGSGKILKILGIYPVIGLVTAVTGVGIAWDLIKTSAVGTGGTTITGRPLDSNNTAISASITARQKPTGGATTNFTYFSTHLHSEETNAGSAIAWAFNLLRWFGDYAQPMVLREGEGLSLVQSTNTAAGNQGWVILGTQE